MAYAFPLVFCNSQVLILFCCFRTLIGHRCHQHHRTDTANAVTKIRFLSCSGGRQEGLPPSHPFQGYHECRRDRVLWWSQGKIIDSDDSVIVTNSINAL